MKRLKDSAAAAGYDQEEAYFYKREQELIQNLRSKAKLTLIQGGKADSQEGGSTTEEANSEQTQEPARKRAA